MKDPNITGDVSKKGMFGSVPSSTFGGEKMAPHSVLLEAEFVSP